ncbi:MAG TPA: twin-arginine translocase subunit TatC [Verrucomicrobiae bacterium]|nr:twin-arginine translocase subunit TatC [Verrucomicrobiae bacterium]
MADEPDAEHLEPEDQEGGPVKSFLEHLEDLRWVLIKSAAALTVAMLVCLIGGNYVVDIIKRPMMHASIGYPGTNQVVTVLYGTNQLGVYTLSGEQEQSLGLGSNRFVAVQIQPDTIGTNHVLGWIVDSDPAMAARAQQLHVELINLSPAGGFVVAFQVAFYGGMLLAAPFIMYFVAVFVFPALKLRERKYVYRALFYGGGLFVAGVAFCYFILLPVALSASQLYSRWLGFGAYQWRAEDYISFVCKFMLGMGLGFELPVVILTMVKIGVVGYKTLAKIRPYMIVINLILGAVLTTPEVITQITMFVPLQCLYELSVWIAWYWEQPDRSKARRRLVQVLVVALLVVALLVLLYKFGWPLVAARYH